MIRHDGSHTFLCGSVHALFHRTGKSSRVADIRSLVSIEISTSSKIYANLISIAHLHAVGIRGHRTANGYHLHASVECYSGEFAAKRSFAIGIGEVGFYARFEREAQGEASRLVASVAHCNNAVGEAGKVGAVVGLAAVSIGEVCRTNGAGQVERTIIVFHFLI